MMVFIGNGKTACFDNKQFCVLHVQSNTTVFLLLIQRNGDEAPQDYMFRPTAAIFRF